MVAHDETRMEFLTSTKDSTDISVPNVVGVFEWPLKFSGFDLRRIKSFTNKCHKAFRIIVSILLCIVFFLSTLASGTEGAQPFTVRWADRNIYAMISAFGFVCGICLIFWTKNDFVELFQNELIRVKAFRRLPNEQIDNYRKLNIGCTIVSVILVLLFVLASFNGLFYLPTKEAYNGTEVETLHPSVQNMFGTAPIVYLLMGYASAIALSLYWLSHEHLRREMEYFNEELKKASDAGEFANVDNFIEFGTRHMGLIGLLDLLNSHLGKMAMINCFTVGTAMCFSIYLAMGFMKDLSIPYSILISIMNIMIGHWMSIIIGEPRKIQKQVHHTKKILLADANLPVATEPKIISSYRLFIDRCNHCSKIHMLAAVPIGRKTSHWVLFLIPNVATVLVFSAKLAGVIGR